jgi:hypothetical protein
MPIATLSKLRIYLQGRIFIISHLIKDKKMDALPKKKSYN